ncbi:MAG: energy transducer TonB [Dysgonamonadaceae bacterium]|jgi:protein TonB|nr:energy transducer TonB [Dysgonamonadaceae bacterium]
MGYKKTLKADLEYDRGIFLLLGFVVALATVFVALEWESNEVLSPEWITASLPIIEEEDIGIQDIPMESESKEAVKRQITEPEAANDDFNIVEKEEEPEKVETEPEKVEKEINTSNIPEEEAIHAEADVMPQFEGGYSALVRFIYNNMEYPVVALKQRIQGRVWCSFIVNKDGSISDVRIEQGVYAFLDDEALRVMQIMPPWTPGTIAGKQVRVKIYLPVVFKI